ncbi:hypothetical protein [Flavobacterium tructae]|nr:hypothetical protein [Flavobacterium tructae]
MKIKNSIFFKKYKIIKIILLIHLLVSFIVTTTMAVHGLIDGNIKKPFQENYENYIALYNPKEYLKDAVFVVDTAYIETQATSNQGSSTTFKDYTIIRGHLLYSKTKQEITCKYVNSNVLDSYYHQKVEKINVLKNSINGIAFLEDKKYISSEKMNAVANLYFNLSLIPLILILLILKIKSK